MNAIEDALLRAGVAPELAKEIAAGYAPNARGTASYLLLLAQKLEAAADSLYEPTACDRRAGMVGR